VTGRSSPRTANKCLLVEAFDTLFNGRDFEAAERYESALAMAEGNCVMVQQDEATKAASKSGLPMFGETFPE